MALHPPSLLPDLGIGGVEHRSLSISWILGLPEVPVLWVGGLIQSTTLRSLLAGPATTPGQFEGFCGLLEWQRSLERLILLSIHGAG